MVACSFVFNLPVRDYRTRFRHFTSFFQYKKASRNAPDFDVNCVHSCPYLHDPDSTFHAWKNFDNAINCMDKIAFSGFIYLLGMALLQKFVKIILEKQGSVFHLYVSPALPTSTIKNCGFSFNQV